MILKVFSLIVLLSGINAGLLHGINGGLGAGLGSGGLGLGGLGGGLGGLHGGIGIGDLQGGIGVGSLGSEIGVGHHTTVVDVHTPARYEFKYGVEDHKTGDRKQQAEVRSGDVVKGEYSLAEPDGTIRVVKYTADDHNGFNAVVSRIGHAVHPQVVHVHKALVPIATHGTVGLGGIGLGGAGLGGLAGLGHGYGYGGI